MPSTAYNKFHDNLEDVRSLLLTHEQLNPVGQGRRAMGHLTRSAVVMLAACWERYIEQVLLECIDILTNNLPAPGSLPMAAQKTISAHIKSRLDKHELAPLTLANFGWVQVYRELAVAETEKLNTPKSGQVDVMYQRYLGIARLSDCWSITAQQLDDFIAVRGDIAHNGREAPYVRVTAMKEYIAKIYQTVIETDNFLLQTLCGLRQDIRAPWNRTNHRAYPLQRGRPGNRNRAGGAARAAVRRPARARRP